MDTAVRFSHSSGNTDFYEDEILILAYETIQPMDLIWLVSGEAYISCTKKSYVKITITFDLTRSSTIDRIEDLFDLKDSYNQPEVMTCYYRYGIDTTTYSKTVQMMRDTMSFPFSAGRKESRRIKIVFCEATDFPTTTVSVAQQIDLGVS